MRTGGRLSSRVGLGPGFGGGFYFGRRGLVGAFQQVPASEVRIEGRGPSTAQVRHFVLAALTMIG